MRVGRHSVDIVRTLRKGAQFGHMLHHWRTARIMWYLQKGPTPHKERGRGVLLPILQRKLPGVSPAFRLNAELRNTNTRAGHDRGGNPPGLIQPTWRQTATTHEMGFPSTIGVLGRRPCSGRGGWGAGGGGGAVIIGDQNNVRTGSPAAADTRPLSSWQVVPGEKEDVCPRGGDYNQS